MFKKLDKLILGFLVSNLFAMGVVATCKLSQENFGKSVIIYSTFVIVPMAMNIIAAWFWRKLNMTGGKLTGYAILNGVIAICLSLIFLGEGVICLIIVSPLIFAFGIAGAFIGRAMFRKNNQKLNVSVVSLLLVLVFADVMSDHTYENLVADELIINAPPEKVWPHVVAFKPIEKPNNYWLFNIGMPSPAATTVEGNYLGAGRRCIFSNGYIFEEKIVTFDKNKDLTFDIIGQPLDPEIMGHIDILKGQFLLKDNGNGTTTLTGNSWYRLHVFPVSYYDIWARSITRNVHLRVMEHIKTLSEQP